MLWIRSVSVILCSLAVTAHQHQQEQPLTQSIRIIRKIYNHCENSEEIVKCLKQQALKITERAFKVQNIQVIDGINLVRTGDESRSTTDTFNDDQIKKMSSQELDKALGDRMSRFLNTHQVSVSMNSILDKSSDEQFGRMIEEGRGKLKKYIGPILTAIAIKGGFVAMAFQTIAMIAGKALLIGKIALVLSAIIGLKKLVSSGEAHEKTTYEIVKHPQVSQSHSYSSSHYGGDYDTSAGGGHYRRSLKDGEDDAQYVAYSAYATQN